MGKLHEILAAEKTVNAAWNEVEKDTNAKLGKSHFFMGETKTLNMLEDTPANSAAEEAAKSHRKLPTNVLKTFEYALGLYAAMENLQLQKNLTNASARGTVFLHGMELFKDLPVDQLLGLESRVARIRTLIDLIPTLDAGIKWTFDATSGDWLADGEVTTKTETVLEPVILYPATDKHPAQVKEASKVSVVGKFTTTRRSGAATTLQKATLIQLADSLLIEIKKARMRANDTTIVQTQSDFGQVLAELFLQPLRN